MNLVPQYFTCPCCGYDKLDFKPYKNFPPVMVDTKSLTPPYDKYWGFPSYGVCDCCGYEFGNDDDPGPDVPADSFEEYRAHWITVMGGEWFFEETEPESWSIEKQLANLVDVSMPKKE